MSAIKTAIVAVLVWVSVSVAAGGLLLISACGGSSDATPVPDVEGAPSPDPYVTEMKMQSAIADALARERIGQEMKMRAAIAESKAALQKEMLGERLALQTAMLEMEEAIKRLQPVAPTSSAPAARAGDICDLSIPMQKELLDVYGVRLCSSVRLGELYRLEGLSLDGGLGRFRGQDFADMPNLTHLDLSTSEGESVAPDFFVHLGGLKTLLLRGGVQLNTNPGLQSGAGMWRTKALRAGSCASGGGTAMAPGCSLRPSATAGIPGPKDCAGGWPVPGCG